MSYLTTRPLLASSVHVKYAQYPKYFLQIDQPGEERLYAITYDLIYTGTT